MTPHPVKPSRLHLLVASTIGEAALFLTSSLLLSHNIRRDTVAAVLIGSRWLIARGDRVRYLRPDLDTAEGWVKAALRGKHVGAILSDSPPEPVGRIYYTSDAPCPPSLRGLGVPATLCYGSRASCPYSESISGEIPIPGPPWLAAAVANVALDRLEAGLEPCPSPHP